MLCKKNLLAAAVSVCLLSMTAAASAEIVGGGASLPSNLYIGTVDKAGFFSAGTTPLLDDFAYTSISSGAGKAAFLNNDPLATPATPFKNRAGTAWPAGTTVHFAGSDSVLAQTEIDTYNNNYNKGPVGPGGSARANYGPMIQIPSVGTSVTLPFNQSGGALNLPVATVCGIFSGRVNTWAEARGGAHNGGAARDIFPVYRDESSGTSELLTRFLANNCSATDPGFFSTTTTFSASPGFLGAAPPAFYVRALGSGGMIAAVNDSAHPGRIGYVSPDFIAPTNTNTPDPLIDSTKVAKVAGASPTATAVGLTLATALPPTTNFTDQKVWVPTVFTTPANGYPIVGYTTLEFGQCYLDSNAATRVRALITDLTDNSLLLPKIQNHRFIQVPLALRTLIKLKFLTGDTNHLAINDATICGSGATAIGRPL